MLNSLFGLQLQGYALALPLQSIFSSAELGELQRPIFCLGGGSVVLIYTQLT